MTDESVKRPPLVECSNGYARHIGPHREKVSCVNPRPIKPSASRPVEASAPACICRIVSSGPDYTLHYDPKCPRHGKGASAPAAPPAPDAELRELRARMEERQAAFTRRFGKYVDYREVLDSDRYSFNEECQDDARGIEKLKVQIAAREKELVTAPPAKASAPAIEEAERIVDRMTCPDCGNNETPWKGWHRRVRCIAQGRAIVAALVAEGWGKR